MNALGPAGASRSPACCTTALIDRIESSDALVLASPTNFGSVPAVFNRFMERLVAYAYWPWGKPCPEFRKRHVKPKQALLISSSAAPSWMGRCRFGSTNQLKMTAKAVGAIPVGVVFTDVIASAPAQRLPDKTRARAECLARGQIE